MTQPASRSLVGPVLIVGGGIVAIGGVVFALRRSSAVVDKIENQIAASPVSLPPSSDTVSKLPTFSARTTGYWPLQEGLSSSEKKMEGGKKDRRGRPIYTLEMHQRDPIRYPYVSVAGDYTVFPDGQRLILSAWPGVVFRVVDTGGHFFGAKKVYRVAGYEPLDIAVDSPNTKVPKLVDAKIVPGDHFGWSKGPKQVETSRLRDQSVRMTGEIIEGRTVEDYEALARAIESELSGRPMRERRSAAWAIRNRAEDLDLSLKDLLAPHGRFGAAADSGGYVSTKKAPTDVSRALAHEIADAPKAADPTSGAIDYWIPSDQRRMCALGDVYRASLLAGDAGKALQYAKYADYGNESDVRAAHENDGLCVAKIVGKVELLRRVE